MLHDDKEKQTSSSKSNRENGLAGLLLVLF